MTDSVDIEDEYPEPTPEEMAELAWVYWGLTPEEEAQYRQYREPTPEQIADWREPTPEEVAHQAIDDWNNTHMYDADSWFVIPEFGVQPEDVGWKGFDRHIFHASNPGKAESVRGLVKTARTLARRYFASLSELDAAHDQALRREGIHLAGERERVAIVYRHAMLSLKWNFHKDEICHLLSTAELIATWAARGAQAASQELERRRQLPRDAAQHNRPAARSGIKARVLEQMALGRENDVPFTSFLASWLNDTKDGLRLEDVGNEKYLVTYENSVSEQAEDYQREYTRGTLIKMYSASWAPA